MKVSKDKILGLVIKDAPYEVYKLKTIRGSLIFYDNQSNFFGSWDDLWHVIVHLSNTPEFHWTQLTPTYISKDFQRIIINKLHQHKKETPIENLDLHLRNWEAWESFLYAEESTFDVDLSNAKLKHLKVITLDYMSFENTQELFLYLDEVAEKEDHIVRSLISLSNGKKITSGVNESLAENGITPGDILRIE